MPNQGRPGSERDTKMNAQDINTALGIDIALFSTKGVGAWLAYRNGDAPVSQVPQGNGWTRAEGCVTGATVSAHMPRPACHLAGVPMVTETSRYYGVRTVAQTDNGQGKGKATRTPSLATVRKRVAAAIDRAHNAKRWTTGDMAAARELIESYAQYLPVEEYDQAVDLLDAAEMERRAWREDSGRARYDATDAVWEDSYGVRITDDWVVNLRAARMA